MTNLFGERLKKLRGKMSIDELVDRLNKKYQRKFSKSMIWRYENGQSDPKMETVRVLSDYFQVSSDYLTGITDDTKETFKPELNEKDERNIQIELQNMIDGLSEDSYAAFDGQDINEMDPEDRELLISSLENSLRLAKRLSKQKFTPKKYRDE